MRTLELKPEDLPIALRLKLPEGEKEYLLLRTKQNKLLLNKRIKEAAKVNR